MSSDSTWSPTRSLPMATRRLRLTRPITLWQRHLFLITLFLGTASIAVGTGAVDIPLAALWRADSSLTTLQYTVLTELRLPRVVLAAAVGATLATSGAALQGLFRNPLAEPQLIGVSAGAALGAICLIVLGDQIALPQSVRPYAVSLGAIVGAVTVTAALYGIASRRGSSNVTTMLLIGIAVNAIASVGIGIFTFIADDGELRSLTFWTMGSFGGAQWTTVVPVLVLMGSAMAVLLSTGPDLDRLQLGELEAKRLGVAVTALKRKLVFATAIGVGAAVSVSGIIGFAGLVIPHIARMLVGVHHSVLIPVSALMGATLAMAADTGSRTLAAPTEIPVGLLTAAIGAPFFLWLVMRTKAR